MVDLSTTYLGLKLKNPLVASSSPISKKLDTVRQLEDAGISAIVMYSLFEEQITHESNELDHFLTLGTESYAEAISYFPDINYANLGADAYIEHLHRVKEAVNIPVIGSLNGISTGGWVKYARNMEEAGADAIELNLYYVPTNPELTSNQLEASYLQVVKDIHETVKIPLAIKLSPFFTAFPNFAASLVKTGAKGLVLFNRFYQPDIDIDNLEVVPRLVLSTSEENRLPLRWIAILYGKIKADFALTSGVHNAEDVLKSIMAGANVAMMTSELLANGINRVSEILTDMHSWLETHEYQSVLSAIGSMSQQSVQEPAAFERANYIKALNNYKTRVV
jgi:dihydroorotate dehydrogenase (fumarate)